jgi:hypothetical protein
VNTVRLRNKDDICATDEKSTFHDSNHSPDPLFEPRWISDRTEAAVENAVSAVSDEGLTRRPQTQPDSSAEDLESRLSCFQPERDDLYRNRCVRTQSVDQLGAVHDDCEAPARGGDDLLAQQRSAESLDEIERAAFHLVCAVDRKILTINFVLTRSSFNHVIRIRTAVLIHIHVRETNSAVTIQSCCF